jgi:predicted ArsR family transcriptional regulator
MATVTDTDELRNGLSEQQLRKLILRHLKKWDHACAPDLAAQIGHGITAKQVLPVLDSLVNEGVLRLHENEPSDERKYEPPFQTRYELAE